MVSSVLLLILAESRYVKPIANAICEMQGKGSDALLAIQKKLDQVNMEIKNVMNAIKMGIVTESTKGELLALEDDRKRLEAKKDEESLGQHRFTREQIEMALKTLACKSVKDVRQRRTLLDTFVKKITIDKDGNISIDWDIFGYNPDDKEYPFNAIKVRIDASLLRHLICIRTLYIHHYGFGVTIKLDKWNKIPQELEGK